MDEELKKLERRVDKLIGICQRLKDENLNLRHGQDGIIREQTRLAEKNRMARERLETIIGRLHDLENTQ